MKDKIYKLQYIKAGGKYYKPIGLKEQNPDMRDGVFKGVCFITQIGDGRWQVDYYDDWIYAYKHAYDNQEPRERVILYPSGIEEIKYIVDEKY